MKPSDRTPRANAQRRWLGDVVTGKCVVCASSLAAGIGLAGLFTGIATAHADDSITLPNGETIILPSGNTINFPFGGSGSNSILSGGNGAPGGSGTATATGGNASGTGVDVERHAKTGCRPRPGADNAARSRRRRRAPHSSSHATRRPDRGPWGSRRRGGDSRSTATFTGASRGTKRNTIRLSMPPLVFGASSST